MFGLCGCSQNRKLDDQKCPSVMKVYGGAEIFFDWQGNNVTVTSTEEDYHILTGASYDEATRTLTLKTKYSDVYSVKYVFDEEGLLQKAVYLNDNEIYKEVVLSYSKDKAYITATEIEYDDGEEDDREELYTLATYNDNGYVNLKRSDKEQGTVLTFNECGDWTMILPRESCQDAMVYDKDNNLLQMYFDEDLAYEYSYSDVKRNEWRNIIIALYQFTIIASGGDGYIGEIPMWLQLGYQAVSAIGTENLPEETKIESSENE